MVKYKSTMCTKASFQKPTIWIWEYPVAGHSLQLQNPSSHYCCHSLVYVGTYRGSTSFVGMRVGTHVGESFNNNTYKIM
jgi:hypothetical protein